MFLSSPDEKVLRRNSRHEAWDHVKVIDEATGKLASERYERKPTECDPVVEVEA